MATYLRKNIADIMEKIDKNSKLPAKWDKFINDESLEHNLLLKYKNKLYCTHCQLEFNSKKKIRNHEKCPYCKNKLEIRRNTIKHKLFEKELTLLENVNGQIVIRLFNMRSFYHHEEKTFNHSVAEYGRIVVNENVHLLNERAHMVFYSCSIIHKSNSGRWRRYNGYCGGLSSRGSLYSYNLKKVLKGTIYQYSNLWEFVKKVKGCDLENLLTGVAKYPSFELLVKLKLYNLALDAPRYNIKGNFKTRFGVDKEYYDFMKKYNINSEELRILKLVNTPDIELIRYFRKNYNITVLEQLSKYIDIRNTIEYLPSSSDAHIYLDYLEFAERLNKNLKDKKILFPKDLKKAHDRFYKLIKIIENEEIIKKIDVRYKNLLSNTYKDQKYIVFPAKSVEDLKDESNQQGHCVRDYAERYANAICDIYFMRKKECPEKSLVTIEVRNNKIYQKRIKGNELPNEKENRFLEKWQEKVLQQSCRV